MNHGRNTCIKIERIYKMEWWKIILILYAGIYVCLLIYQILDNRNKKMEKIKYEMERTEKKDKSEKKMKKVRFIVDNQSVFTKITTYVTDMIVNFWKWIITSIYSIEQTIRQLIESIHQFVFSTIYIFLRKSGIISKPI